MAKRLTLTERGARQKAAQLHIQLSEFTTLVAIGIATADKCALVTACATAKTLLAEFAKKGRL